MAEEESDQEAERLGEELVAIVESPPGPTGLRTTGDGRGGAGGGSCGGGGVGISSRDYCRRFCQVVEDYAGRWQVPLPQLQVLQTALCCFTSASASFPDECEHVQYVLSSLALSFFELLLFFGRDEFYEEPLKDILGSFQECQNHLRRYGNVNLELVTRIIRDGGPWEDPVLQAVLKAQPASQEIVNKYLSSENPLFFELRARYLIACERIPEAMALIKCCINHPEISKDLYFHQALFTCLFMSPVEDQLFREHLLKTDCKSGIDIICNTEKEGKTMLALQLCESFLISQLQNGDMYCIWELIFIWSKLQLKSNPSKQVFVDQCYQLLRTATNVRVIFPFMKIIKDEVEEEGLQICVEICGCALQLDLHDDPKTKCLIYKTIAHFLPNDLEILRICALSIFFLERSLEAYHTVEELYKRPDEEYNEGTSSVQNRVRFELLPILKKGLFFDPEFWNFIMIKKNCVALLSDKSAVSFLNESTLENSTGNVKKAVEQQGLAEGLDSFTDQSTGELDPDELSGVQLKGHINAKKNLTALNASKVDHSVPRHRCMLCNKEFLGGHIVRHAQAHQKKGSFSCVICGRKFRNRGLMQKHLKNHVKKIQRQQIASAQQEDQENPALEEIKCSDTFISFENGNSDNKDLEVETITASSDGNKDIIPAHVGEFTAVPVSESEDVIESIIENGRADTSLNNVSEPLPICVDDYEEEEDEEGDYEEDDYDLNQETSVLHKINGTVCHPKDIYATDQEGNFKCPALGCVRIFKRIGFLNKHARTVHPTDLNVRQTVMKWSKGKCKFCQRQFEDSQHFIDHLNRHSYPNVYFCLHFNCNESFKLPFQLAQHTKSHRIFQAQCSFPECHELFEDLPLLYEHEAQHYLSKTPESSAQPSEAILWDVLTDSKSNHQEKDSSSNEKQTLSLPVSTSKSRKDSTEPKTCIESTEKKTDRLIQNGNEHSDDTVSDISLIDQKMPNIEPNSENNCSISDLVNGHSGIEQTPLVSSNPALKIDTNRIRTENGSILPSVVPQEHSTLPVSQAPSKPNLTSEHTSYGLILTKPYVRPLPPSYLDERYLSMPKRRKFLTDRVDACSDQDNVCKKSVKRLRCGKCLTTYCNAEALEAHLAQKKCQTLFGFDSDDESKSSIFSVGISVEIENAIDLYEVKKIKICITQIIKLYPIHYFL
ncbi:zinc finger protein 654 isoform X1 [Phacochoerus africanus]|uniref:zinc finger protein 654 isoform X1 n=2 Tax=Phacochoerus africanus TaxID=41426 RepID=UPI001FDA5708|nr:zinc finger protein 654 isoform X1 [Phacochoerus africanus]